jgi:hypothetical protein
MFLAIAAMALTSAGSQSLLNPRDGALLPSEAGKEVLHQCSRGVPAKVDGTWRPTEEQIASLERLLPPALHAATKALRLPYRPTNDFRRQYLGIIGGSRKRIYVNAFPRDSGDPVLDGVPAARKFDWHRQAVVVCDGGPTFFGVEYDPVAKSFSHFEFNGSP